jgi:cytochrome c553
VLTNTRALPDAKSPDKMAKLRGPDFNARWTIEKFLAPTHRLAQGLLVCTYERTLIVMKYQTGVAFLAALALSASPLAAQDTTVTDTATKTALLGDAAAGKKLYTRNCRGCHGATAKGASSYPRLVGLPPEYLIEKLERYRAGEKFGPNTPLMAQRVKKLSDQDFANVAVFIASLEEE